MVVNSHSQCLEISQADESARCRCCNRATYKGGTIARIGIYWGSSLSSSTVYFGITSNRYFLFIVFILFFSFSHLHRHEFVLHSSQVDLVSREEDLNYVWLALKLSLPLSRYKTQ